NGDMNTQQGVTGDESDGSPEPVTVSFNHGWEDRFEEWYRPYIEEEFPHVTLEYINTGIYANNPQPIEETLLAGTVPDILYYDNDTDARFAAQELEFDYDLNELIDQNNFDLNRYEDRFIEDTTLFTEDDSLIALPIHAFQGGLLYFNKDIFDIFAASYPT